MRALALGLAIACSGCATTWIALQAGGGQRALDENARDELVPIPGIDERLAVTVPLVTEYEVVTDPQTHATYNGPAKPFAIDCRAEQRTRSVQYHAAFRYGGAWKKGTAVAFLVEGALASVLLLTANTTDHAGNYVYGGFLAADAAITGALFFIPRKEIYREEPVALATELRTDCPDGLGLEIAGTSYPIDAAGHVSDVAEAALADWMTTPNGPVHVTFDGQEVVLPIDAAQQCAWLRDHAKQSCMPGVMSLARTAIATFSVAAGTLTAQR